MAALAADMVAMKVCVPVSSVRMACTSREALTRRRIRAVAPQYTLTSVEPPDMTPGRTFTAIQNVALNLLWPLLDVMQVQLALMLLGATPHPVLMNDGGLFGKPCCEAEAMVPISGQAEPISGTDRMAPASALGVA